MSSQVPQQVAATLEMYHVGCVVPDLVAACERHSRLFGTRWASTRRPRFQAFVDGRVQDVELLVSYSIDGPQHVELIQDVTGTVWGPRGLHLNHVGYYTDDLRRSMRDLEEAGLPARVHDIDDDGGARVFSYHQDESGLWVELVHTSFRDNLRGWIDATLAGRPHPGPTAAGAPLG